MKKKNFCDLWKGKYFSDETQKLQATKEKINKVDFVKF